MRAEAQVFFVHGSTAPYFEVALSQIGIDPQDVAWRVLSVWLLDDDCDEEYLERASRVAIDAGIGRGVLEDGGDRRLNCRGEEASQSSALFLIPDLPDPRMPTARRQTSSLGGTLGVSGAAMTLTK